MSTTNEVTTAAPGTPPDRELGHELDDTARVWKVFRGEAIDHDDALLKTWNETVNILLTFAGLFSAAVTSFVVASTGDLKPDPNAYVANLLFALGNASGGDASPSPFAHLPAPPPLEAAPTSLARLVNGLWFTSLFLALAAALLCILVKQWLDEYTARTRGSAKHPHEWAQRRSFYFQGLIDWNVAAIISFLPLFLHLALFLFLAGLTAFLWDLDSTIRWVMLVLISLLLAFYMVSLFIPVWSAACPYATRLLAQLRNLGYRALVTVFVLRKRTLALPCITSIHRVFHRRSRASLPMSLHYGNALTPDSQINNLLEQSSRRRFERVLRRITKMEEDLPEPEQGDFGARLDCSSLEWLMHDVSDSDAVAVAWQSIGAFLEEPKSIRFTRMRTTLTGLVKYAGGDDALWRTLRTDGVLDDLQLDRITRSALFIASSTASYLDHMLSFGVPGTDYVCLENTLAPDAALIYAYSRRFTQASALVQVLHRLHEKTLRPLPSTVFLRLSRLLPNHDQINSAIGLLRHCDLGALPATAWTHVASFLCQHCTGEANPPHKCTPYCVVNALCARALQLMHETSDSSNPRRNSAAPFNAYSHVRLAVRVISAVRDSGDSEPADLSTAVWTVLTDTRYLLARPIQQEDRIRALDWPNALVGLAQSSHKVYASFATQYNLICSRLLRGVVRKHSTVLPDGGIDFDGYADNALAAYLGRALRDVTPWKIDSVDPALRPARLQSSLTLAESASIAFCSVDSGLWSSQIRSFVQGVTLLACFPTDLALTGEEHNEWADLCVSAVQHLLVLDPRPWYNLREAVTVSTDDDVKTFFGKVHARLTEAGPCTKGACAGKGPTDWLAALGPVP